MPTFSEFNLTLHLGAGQLPGKMFSCLKRVTTMLSCVYLLRTAHDRKEQCIEIVLPGFLRQALDLGMNFLETSTLATRFTHFCRGFAGLV